MTSLWKLPGEGTPGEGGKGLQGEAPIPPYRPSSSPSQPGREGSAGLREGAAAEGTKAIGPEPPRRLRPRPIC